jgi:hypothetical protein
MTKGSDLERDIRRIDSINRSSEKINIGRKPLQEKSAPSRKIPNEGELDQVLASLKRYGIDPTKPAEPEEGGEGGREGS